MFRLSKATATVLEYQSLVSDSRSHECATCHCVYRLSLHVHDTITYFPWKQRQYHVENKLPDSLLASAQGHSLHIETYHQNCNTFKIGVMLILLYGLNTTMA